MQTTLEKPPLSYETPIGHTAVYEGKEVSVVTKIDEPNRVVFGIVPVERPQSVNSAKSHIELGQTVKFRKP